MRHILYSPSLEMKAGPGSQEPTCNSPPRAQQHPTTFHIIDAEIYCQVSSLTYLGSQVSQSTTSANMGLFLY